MSTNWRSSEYQPKSQRTTTKQWPQEQELTLPSSPSQSHFPVTQDQQYPSSGSAKKSRDLSVTGGIFMLALAITAVIFNLLIFSFYTAAAVFFIGLLFTGLLLVRSRRRDLMFQESAYSPVETQETKALPLDPENGPSFWNLLFGTNPETGSNDFDLSDDDENDFGTTPSSW